MRSLIALVAVALTIGCSSPPASAPPPQCPEAATSTPTTRMALVGTPPFKPVSASALPPHRSVTWRLHVSAAVDGHGMQSWEVAETRAGDVPLLSGSIWRCRFGPVDVSTNADGQIAREVRCSSDGWRTSTGDTAEAYANEKPIAANIEMREGGESAAVVTLQPCDGPSGCAPAPELP